MISDFIVFGIPFIIVLLFIRNVIKNVNWQSICEYVCLITVLIVPTCFLINVLVMLAFCPRETITYSTKIMSLKDSSSVSGSFFLGSGRIEGTDYYVFYKDYNGGILRQKIRSGNTVIYETNKIKPKYEYSIKYMDSSNGKFKSYFMGDVGVTGHKFDKKIYVPEGTVIKQFNLG